jgi:hypothetical protein
MGRLFTPHERVLTDPQLMTRIRSRTSFGTVGRPGFPCWIFHLQKRRKPFRCQAITVAGLTISRTDFQSPHRRRSQTQKIRSAGVSFRRLGDERRSTLSCCRKARFPVGAEPRFGTARQGHQVQ